MAMMTESSRYEGNGTDKDDGQLTGGDLRQEIARLQEKCRPESVNSNDSQIFIEDFDPNGEDEYRDNDLWMDDMYMIHSIKQLADEYEEEQEQEMEDPEQLQSTWNSFELVGANRSPVYPADDEMKDEIDVHVSSHVSTSNISSTAATDNSRQREDNTCGVSTMTTLRENTHYSQDDGNNQNEICLISQSPVRTSNVHQSKVSPGDENVDEGEVKVERRENIRGGDREPHDTRRVDFISLSQSSDEAGTTNSKGYSNKHGSIFGTWHNREPMKELSRDYRSARTTPVKKAARNRRIDDMFRDRSWAS